MKQSPEVSGPAARLAQSRAQLARLLLPKRPGTFAGTAGAGGAFPRSATMRFLCSGRAREAAGLLVLSVLTPSPARTMRWLRFIPVTALTRFLIHRFAKSSREPLISARSTEVHRRSPSKSTAILRTWQRQGSG